MKHIEIEDIHWHDSLILSVSITPERNIIEMRLLTPENWEKDIFAEVTLVFEEAYGYKEFEGPIHGSPTILSASILSKNQEWSEVRLETNAGYRELNFQQILIK